MTARPNHQRTPSRQWIALSSWAVLLWGGCVTGRQLETLEAELRQQQDAVQLARKQTDRIQSELTRAREETELLRSQMAAAGQGAPLPEQTGNLVRLSQVKINTLLSGGKDRDGLPGDDLLVALISPLDEQGDLVKIAGEVEIEAFDMTLPSDDKRVGHWAFDTEQAAKAWHSGFVGAGLQFELPWQDLPTSKELLVHVRLKTTDGRQFDSSTPLKVSPQAGNVSAQAATRKSISKTQPVKFEVPPPVDGRDILADRIVPAELNMTAEQDDASVVPRPIRPVPFYDDVEPGPTARPFPSEAAAPEAKEALQPKADPDQKLTLKEKAKPAVAPNKRPAAAISAPPPAVKKPGRASLDDEIDVLDGTETSDNWTDETLPRLR